MSSHSEVLELDGRGREGDGRGVEMVVVQTAAIFLTFNNILNFVIIVVVRDNDWYCHFIAFVTEVN